MQVNVQQFLEESGITEPFYPGKRLVHALRQEGEYKSHCVVLDWRDPSKIKIEVKAGLSGKDLEPKRLKYYPVCFQAPTYVNIEVINDNAKAEEDEETSSSSSGKGGGGGKQPAKKKISMASAFSEVLQGKIPELGKVVEMIVLGKEIAQEAYGRVLGGLAHQIQHAKISATDLLAKAGDMITRYQPPSFMKPTGDETGTYKYDRVKNENIGFRQTLG